MNTTQNQDTGQDGDRSTNPQAGIGDAMRQGAHELKHGTEELRSKATEVAKEATREGQAQVDQYRSVAAQRVDTIAESVKAAAAKLQEGDVGQWSTQISGMADSMTRFSKGLREKSAEEVMHDVNRLARENPAIFVGSAVAIGFGLTRLVRATAQPRPPKESQRSQDTSDSSDTADDMYTSSTLTGSGHLRASATPQGGRVDGVGVGSTGPNVTGSESHSSSGAGVGAGRSGAGLGGGSSQSEQAGFSGTGGSQGGGDMRSGDGHWGDNDRSTSS